MTTIHMILVVFLLATLLGALPRIFMGPSAADRIMAAQLFGSTGVASLLVLAEMMNMPALRNVALAFVLLASLLALAFTRIHKASGPDGEANP